MNTVHTIKWKNFRWFVPEENLNVFFKYSMFDINKLILSEARKSRLLKKVRIKSLYIRDIETGDGGEILVKVYKNEGVKSFLFARAKAFREFSMFLKCKDRGIQTIVPLCAGEEKNFIFAKRGYVILKKLADVEGLDEFLKRTYNSTTPAEIILRRVVIKEYAKFANKIHSVGIYQDDFDPNNILISLANNEVKLFLIDFERARTFQKPLDLKKKIFLLSKLNRFPFATKTDRFRFLKTYFEKTNNKQEFKYLARRIVISYEKILKRDFLKGCRNAFKENRNIAIRKTADGKFFIRKTTEHSEDVSRMWNYQDDKPSEILQEILENAKKSSDRSGEFLHENKKFIWVKVDNRRLAEKMWRSANGLIRIKKLDMNISVLWLGREFSLLVFHDTTSLVK